MSLLYSNDYLDTDCKFKINPRTPFKRDLLAGRWSKGHFFKKDLSRSEELVLPLSSRTKYILFFLTHLLFASTPTFGCCGLICALKYSVILPWDSWWCWPPAVFPFPLTAPLEVGSAAPERGRAPASGSPLSLLNAVVEQAVAANGGVQGHWGLVPSCDDGASLGRDGSGLADVPRIAATPSSLLVLQGEPGSVISLVPLLLHSPQDTATPLQHTKKIWRFNATETPRRRSPRDSREFNFIIIFYCQFHYYRYCTKYCYYQNRLCLATLSDYFFFFERHIFYNLMNINVEQFPDKLGLISVSRYLL